MVLRASIFSNYHWSLVIGSRMATWPQLGHFPSILNLGPMRVAGSLLGVEGERMWESLVMGCHFSSLVEKLLYETRRDRQDA